MPLSVVDDAGNAVALPDGVKFEKVEDIAGLADKAKKHDEIVGDSQFKNWQNTRKIIEDKDSQITQLNERLKTLGGNQPQPGEPVKTEQVGDVVNQILTKRDQESLGKHVGKLIDESAGGDENRKKVIKEKFDMLSAGRTLTSREEAEALFADAVFLSNKNRDSGAINPLHHVSSFEGAGGGGPVRNGGEDRSKAVSNLSAMGYKFKGDPKKYTQ
jgi:hypothetical protein